MKRTMKRTLNHYVLSKVVVTKNSSPFWCRIGQEQDNKFVFHSSLVKLFNEKTIATLRTLCMLTRNMVLLLVDGKRCVICPSMKEELLLSWSDCYDEFYFFVRRPLVNIPMHWNCTVMLAAVGSNIFSL